MDLVRMLVLASAFGLLAAAHVALVLGLFRRHPRWRALVALVVLPLAPYWGWEIGLRTASVLWLLALVVYGLSLAAAVT